jgi:CHRD domain
MPDDYQRELTPRELHRQRRKEQVQRRRLVAGLCLLGLIIIIIVLVATCSGGSGDDSTTTTSGETTSTTLGAAGYEAVLTGADAVPVVETNGSGTFLMTYDPEKEQLTYTLQVDELDNPSIANIYQGSEGEAGTAIYTLFGGPAADAGYSGILSDGTIKEDDLTGPLAGKTIGDLIALIKDGQAYVSVGTTDHPVDAIRGQITETVEETSTTGEGGTDTTGEPDTTTETTG